MSAHLGPAEDLTQLVIATAVVRLSAVVLLTFGVRVLLTVYSYHRRLAEFYESRASAIAAVGLSNLEELKKLTAILSPEKITFDPPPESPLKEIVDLLKK